MKAAPRIIVFSTALWALTVLGSPLWAQAGHPQQKRENARPARQGEEVPPGDGQRHHRGENERKRWEGFPEGRKQNLKEWFDRFRNLPPEKQQELRKKHAELLRLREEITAEFEEELSKLLPEERKRFIDQRVRHELDGLKRKIGKKAIVRELPPPESQVPPPESEVPPPESEVPPPESEVPPPESKEFARRMGRALNNRNDQLAENLLQDLLADGAIDPEAARNIRSQPREERITSILRLHKQRFMRTIEESVSPEELERFEKMPPRRFSREIRRQHRERGLFGPFAGLCELTPDQREALQGIADEVELERKRDFFFNENLRRRLLEMGAAPEAVDDLFPQPLHRRMEGIRRLLQEVPPEKIPLDLRESMKRPPPPRGHGEEGGRRDGMRPPPPGKDPEKGERADSGRFFHAPGRNR